MTFTTARPPLRAWLAISAQALASGLLLVRVGPVQMPLPVKPRRQEARRDSHALPWCRWPAAGRCCRTRGAFRQARPPGKEQPAPPLLLVLTSASYMCLWSAGASGGGDRRRCGHGLAPRPQQRAVRCGPHDDSSHPARRSRGSPHHTVPCTRGPARRREPGGPRAPGPGAAAADPAGQRAHGPVRVRGRGPGGGRHHQRGGPTAGVHP